jgi:hypothetical protein
VPTIFLLRKGTLGRARSLGVTLEASIIPTIMPRNFLTQERQPRSRLDDWHVS